ncbi:MAG: hypothetical protein ACRD44_06685 [Bryobacteraceae bacterium]
MTRSSPIALYFALVFAGGVGVGVLSHRLYSVRTVESAKPEAGPVRRASPSPRDFKQRYLDELNARVHLNADQLQKIDGIMDATKQKFREVASKYEPEFKVIRQDQINQIKALLTAEQNEAFDAFQAEREARIKQRRSEKPPGC